MKISVMIPTYNCAIYLKETLQSVLNQDIGELELEIEVVDDCSTLDTPEELVKQIGNGRVGFYKQPVNVGVTRNFNTCLERASGDWIHILHGDDYVSDNFYSSVYEYIKNYGNEVGVIVCRANIVDSNSMYVSKSETIVDLLKPSKDVSGLLYSNPIRTPCVLVSRDCYVKVGGFNTKFSHVSDWYMWLTAISQCGGIYFDEALANYREFQGNDTGKKSINGSLIEEFELFYKQLLQDGYPLKLEKVKETISYIIKYNVSKFKSNKIKYNKKLYFVKSLKYLSLRDIIQLYFL